MKWSPGALLSARMTDGSIYRTWLTTNGLEESASFLYAKIAHVKQELM